MKRKINAEIIADSISPQGNRLTSFILTYPRFIHAELMTHRMFSRNSASSRAIPFEKMLKMINDDPFIPIAWQRDHKGMQGTEYIDPYTDQNCSPISDWLEARDKAMDSAIEMSEDYITKQLCNRLLEPFMWHTVLVTASEWDNFFELRCPRYHTPVSGDGFYFKSKKDCLANHSNSENLDKLEKFTYYDWQSINKSQAEIHMQALAECMWDTYNESEPRRLKVGDWHIPFGDQINSELLHLFSYDGDHQTKEKYENLYNLNKLKISVARCARLSYMTFENEIDYEKDIKLHDQLLVNKHASPFEHVARVMTNEEYCRFVKGESNIIEFEEPNPGQFVAYSKNWADEDISGWCNNFRGFIPYRYLVDNNGI